MLGLLRGQQQALQKQYEGEVGALADQAKPLEVQLANLLASREQQNKALSTEYGFASEEQRDRTQSQRLKRLAINLLKSAVLYCNSTHRLGNMKLFTALLIKMQAGLLLAKVKEIRR